MQKLLKFFSKIISVCAIFNDQSFSNTLSNDIVSFEQLSPGLCKHQALGTYRSRLHFLAWLVGLKLNGPVKNIKVTLSQ